VARAVQNVERFSEPAVDSAAGVADELGECLRADPERRGAVELGDAALA
jgi:hypothetical protein